MKNEIYVYFGNFDWVKVSAEKAQAYEAQGETVVNLNGEYYWVTPPEMDLYADIDLQYA